MSRWARAIDLLAVLLALTGVGCRQPRGTTPRAAAGQSPAASAAPARSATAAAGIADPPADATRSESGLAWKVLTESEDLVHPGAQDRVVVRYTGWTADGRIFDGTDRRAGKPSTFPMAGLIRGWVEGLHLMVRGEKRRFWIPSRLAYGDQSVDPRAPAGPLVFEVELLEIAPPLAPPTLPPDLTPVPHNARRTSSGLAYRVLAHGTGKQHPLPTSTVDVHYSGWRTNGRMIDSTLPRGEPATLALTNVVKGWSEGVQLMVVGDKARFWIPGRLAYGESASHPGANDGMVVFDIELLGIQ